MKDEKLASTSEMESPTSSFILHPSSFPPSPPPIAVFAYNRPKHLALCLEALSKAEEFCGIKFPIRIYCDAPQKESDAARVEATRKVAMQHTHATLIFREKNHGFRNITEGISAECSTHGKVIVIEDDVIVAPDFLAFMLSALTKYENDPHVFMISGFMYHGMEAYERESFFLRSPFIWGWATWKRAWKHYEWAPKKWEEFLKNKKESALFDFYSSIPFTKNLQKTMTGQWNTWDAQWMFSHFREKGLALYPSRSLVWNCGVGGGVHGKTTEDLDPLLADREFYLHGSYFLDDFKKQRLSSDLLLGKTFPNHVECDKRAMRHLALIFLKERLRKGERKKWRLRLKLFLQTLLLPLTPRV